MSDEDDLGLEPEENEPDEQEQVVEAAATDSSKWQADKAKLLKELKHARALMDRTMLEKFGQEVVDMIPAEVPREKRWELAEKWHTKLTEHQATQTEQAPGADSQEEPTPEEKALAAVGQGPTTGTSGLALDMSAKELLELGKSDPARAAQIIQAKYRTP